MLSLNFETIRLALVPSLITPFQCQLLPGAASQSCCVLFSWQITVVSS